MFYRVLRGFGRYLRIGVFWSFRKVYHKRYLLEIERKEKEKKGKTRGKKEKRRKGEEEEEIEEKNLGFCQNQPPIVSIAG